MSENASAADYAYRRRSWPAQMRIWLEDGRVTWKGGAHEHAHGHVELAEVERAELLVLPPARKRDRRALRLRSKSGVVEIHRFTLGPDYTYVDRAASFEPLARRLLADVSHASPRCRFTAGAHEWWWVSASALAVLLVVIVLHAGVAVMTGSILAAIIGAVAFGLAMIALPTMLPLLRHGSGRPFQPDAPPPGYLRDLER